MRRAPLRSWSTLANALIALFLLLNSFSCQTDPQGTESPLVFPLPESPQTNLFLNESVDARVWDPGLGITARQRVGILFLGGIDGGFIEPGDALYTRLGAHFSRYGVLSVFVKYQEPGNLELCLKDVQLAAHWMEGRGAQRILIMGWSFGGAVGIHATALLPEAVGFVGLSPQSLLTEPVASFRPHQSLFLIHSNDDENIPSWASEQILADAPATLRKKLIPLSGFDHALHRAGNTLDSLLNPWIEGELGFHVRSHLGGGWMPSPLFLGPETSYETDSLN